MSPSLEARQSCNCFAQWNTVEILAMWLLRLSRKGPGSFTLLPGDISTGSTEPLQEKSDHPRPWYWGGCLWVLWSTAPANQHCSPAPVKQGKKHLRGPSSKCSRSGPSLSSHPSSISLRAERHQPRSALSEFLILGICEHNKAAVVFFH